MMVQKTLSLVHSVYSDTRAQLLAPLVGSILALVGVLTLPIETLGLILKYGGGIIAGLIIAVYLVVGGYAAIYRALTKSISLAWGDVLEKHLSDEQEAQPEDVPHKSRIFLAWVLVLLREWLQRNFQYQSFEAYYEDMTESLPTGDSQTNDESEEPPTTANTD